VVVVRMIVLFHTVHQFFGTETPAFTPGRKCRS
jgi:hypothetical protein